MKKIAFVFPGQGAQYIGMGKDASELSAAASEVFSLGSATLGIDIRKMVFEGNEDELKITENTQPAILAASIACMQPLLDAGIRADITAGLSLGEYCAHVASGSLALKDAFAIVRKRGRLMQQAVPNGVGTMAAILGLDEEKVISACHKAATVGIVEPANFNCPGQIVIAGEVNAVAQACILAKEAGAKRVVKLPVSAPFHCSMLKQAGFDLERELENFKFDRMRVPVVSNVTGEVIESTAAIKGLLTLQVSSPVRWEACIRTMIREGVDTFVEIGPGKTLSGFINKIDRGVAVYSADGRDSILETIAALAK